VDPAWGYWGIKLPLPQELHWRQRGRRRSGEGKRKGKDEERVEMQGEGGSQP